MMGAPAAGTSATLQPTSHHGQRSRASFKISVRKRRFLPQLTDDQKSKVSGLTPCHLYHGGKLKGPFRIHVRDRVRRARRLGLFYQIGCTMPRSLQVRTQPAHQQHQSTWHGKAARVVSHHDHDFKKNAWPLFLDKVAPISHRHDSNPHIGCKLVKELQPLAFFLLLAHFLYCF
jgi:hypothetical protein